MKVAHHGDADGISCAALLHSALGSADAIEFVCPKVFGDVSDEAYCLDMRPVKPEYAGVVFDTHPGHPAPNKRRYKLFTTQEGPASFLVWQHFKKEIPSAQWWKVVVGLCGDGAPQLIPTEVMRANPEILDREQYPSSSWEADGKVYFESPLYQQLSSAINSLARIGKPERSLQLLIDADSPRTLLASDEINDAKDRVNRELARLMKESREGGNRPARVSRNIAVWQFSSPFKLTGILAIRSWESNKLTTVTVNMRDGSFSIRGDLATAVLETLTAAEIECGGHPGFAGGHLPEGIEPWVSTDKMLSSLRKAGW